MPRYIDAEKIEYNYKYGSVMFFAQKEQIDDIPTADVESVVHAHWSLEAKHSFGDYFGDCTVYVIAKCSKCGEYWHNRHNICSEILLDYDENEMPFPINEQRIKKSKQNCLREAKDTMRNQYVACECCGARMDEEVKENG